MSEVWYIGRKAIIQYLRPYLDLSPDIHMAWQKVRRWRIRYGLPIEVQPNDKPYIDPAMFEAWWSRYLHKRHEGLR